MIIIKKPKKPSSFLAPRPAVRAEKAKQELAETEQAPIVEPE